jgi:hypothetical protein
MPRALLPLALAACAAGACTADKPDAAKPCDGLLRPADPAVSLPAGIPAGVPSPVLYDTQRAGATTFYYAHAAGDDVVAVRDAIAAAFEVGGLTVESKDAEPPAEAELQFAGTDREGSVQVTPLCRGTVTIRWRVGPR